MPLRQQVTRNYKIFSSTLQKRILQKSLKSKMSINHRSNKFVKLSQSKKPDLLQSRTLLKQNKMRKLPRRKLLPKKVKAKEKLLQMRAKVVKRLRPKMEKVRRRLRVKV